MKNSEFSTLILTGPTATGKTAFALALAQHLPIEIISVDSALVYKGMDIGTAKPSRKELAQVPHHLIDIICPEDSYSAAQFLRDSQAAMVDIRAREKIPLLVGGTMLYIKALIDGLDEIPAVPQSIFQALDREAAMIGWPAMHAKLLEVDPILAKRLCPNDAQRIQRALSVWQATSRPLSSYQSQHLQKDYPSRQLHAPKGIKMVSLEPNDRAWLHQRINQRTEDMMSKGLIDEVRWLRQQPNLHLNLPSMRCVGYRQVWQAMDKGINLDDINQRSHLLEECAAATRQLAKRQITWLRAMPWRNTLDIQNLSHHDCLAAILKIFSAHG